MKSVFTVLLLVASIWDQFAGAQYTVIVVGAGSAGIAAATKLLELNVDVLVLEAESRIGGRVNSVYFGNSYVDMGAEWCHGKDGNVVYNLVKDYNLLSKQTSRTQFLSSDHQHIDNDFSNELHQIFEIYNRSGNHDTDEGITAGEYLIKIYNKTVYDRYQNNKAKLNFALMALETFAHDVLTTAGAPSWFDPSANSDIVLTPGYFYYQWNGYGYKMIFDVMMKKFPVADPTFGIDSRIILNEEVIEISWGVNGVKLTCTSGHIYHADHVIFTPSLGVLKHYHQLLFTPSLPQPKINAIEELGIGGIVKVMMQFSNCWWCNNNFTGFTFVWDYTLKEMLIANYPYGPFRNGRSWLLDLFSIYPVADNPKILSVLFTGDLIPEIEKISDDILIDGFMFVMDIFLGQDYNRTRPIALIRSNWVANPHFHGTNCYQTISSRKIRPSPNLILARPLFDKNNVPRVMFAGEATHPTHYSSVHGAVGSGYREAKRVDQYLMSNV